MNLSVVLVSAPLVEPILNAKERESLISTVLLSNVNSNSQYMTTPEFSPINIWLWLNPKSLYKTKLTRYLYFILVADSKYFLGIAEVFCMHCPWCPLKLCSRNKPCLFTFVVNLLGKIAAFRAWNGSILPQLATNVKKFQATNVKEFWQLCSVLLHCLPVCNNVR